MGTLFKQDCIAEQKPTASLEGVAFRGSKSKWFSKFVDEPSFDRDRGIWARLTRAIYRGGQYTETVIVPATAEVIHHQSHPLAEHTGHGSDKRPTKKSGD